MTDKRQKVFNAFSYLVLSGLVIRILYWFEHSASPFFAVPVLDQKYYDLFARTLVKGGDLSIFAGFRPVLYPSFLSVFYRLGGASGIELSILAQHILGVSTIVIIALISAEIFRSYSAGILSGALYAFSGPPLFFEGELLGTSFLTFLVSLTLCLHVKTCLRIGRSEEILWWLLCGAMTALTAQARTSMLVFLGVYPVFAFYRFVKSKERRSFAPLFALISAIFVIIIFGFVNAGQTDRFMPVPSAGGINFYCGNSPTADGMIPLQDNFTSYGDVYKDSMQTFARQGYEKAMVAEGREPVRDPGAVSRYWFGRTFKTIRSNPLRWLRLMMKKALLIFWNAETANNKSFSFISEKESALLRFLPVRWFLLLALAPLGLTAARKIGDKNGLFIILFFIVSYAMGIVAFFVNSRYRIPLWPAMAVLGGGGLAGFWSAAKRRDMRALTLNVAIVGGISFFSLVNWTAAKAPSYARDYYFRSIAHYERARYAEALRDIEESLRLDGNDANAILQRGNVLFALKRYTEARDVYLEVSGRIPQESFAWNNLGATYEALEDYRNAYLSYLTALRLNSFSRTALQNILMLELRAGLYEKAARRVAELERIDQNNVIAISAKSFLKRSEGYTEEGEKLLKKAYDIDPGTALWVFKTLNERHIETAHLVPDG